MGLTGGSWAGKARQIAAGPQPPAAAGVLLGAAAAAESVVRAVVSDWSLSNALVACLLGLAGTLPLAFLPAAAAVLGICAAAVLSLAGFHTLTVATLCAALIAFFRLGRLGPWRGWAPLLTPAAALTFLGLALFGAPEREVAVLAAIVAALAPTAAWAGSSRRVQVDAEQHGAAREAIMGRLMEHTARGERARIARELHDVVAHHISVIAVQAETARLTTSGMPAAGAQRLSEIGDAARGALTEMRRLLGVLREDTAIEDDEDRSPQPGLGQLTRLLDDVRDTSGSGTRLIIRGRPVTLEPGIELAAFRIVQEALTNALRHAPGAAVDVELAYTERSLLLRIRDNGPGPPEDQSGAGHGLLGMRERAAAVGGELRTGAAPGGGFLIEAALPARVDQSALGAVNVETGSVR